MFAGAAVTLTTVAPDNVDVSFAAVIVAVDVVPGISVPPLARWTSKEVGGVTEAALVPTVL